MEKFVIEGGTPLNGEVTPAGNKNAALPLLAACLLTDQPIILRNVPQIKDVSIMRQLIESLGAQVEDSGFHFVANHRAGPAACGLEPGPLPPHSRLHSDRGPHGCPFW